MNVNLLRVPQAAIGYGRLGLKLEEALRARGVDVWTDLPEAPGPEVSNLACWVSTPSHALGWWKGQHTATFTMWEASRLPESFRESFHEMDTLLVPSQQNLELFSQYHPNVKYVPLGVDPNEWHYRKRQPADTEFRFMVGGSGPRKGVDLVYKAFMTLWGKEGSWGSGPTPKLIMKSPRGGDFYGDRIQMVTGKIPAQDELDLYAYAHCYVQPSRGEGFGLQPLQAIAQGCPTILTDAHGHEAFAKYGWGLGYTMVPSDYFIFGDAGDWWEPDFDELVEQMRYVYEYYDDVVEQARDFSKLARREFTWNNTAKAFIDAFHPELLTTYEGPWERHIPERKLYRARVTSGRSMEIAGTRYVMTVGEDYWVPADVKRILFESGSLDPQCIDDTDAGLTEDQLAARGLYHARSAFCPTCGGQLNDGRLTIEQVYEELARRAS
jgi:glycosyltransferase involved in cell wall biosynthesis